MTSDARLAYVAKAQRALDAAELLFKSGETEGTCNRAYYAMYYAAQAALIGIHGKFVEYKTHRGLVAEFGRQVVVGGYLDAEFGRSLNEVQRVRELADYLGDPPSSDDASSALDAARRFVAAVRTLELP